MNHIDDDRVVFFLQHEKQIREWAGLEKECKAVVQDFLVGCQDDLASLASRLDATWKASQESAAPTMLLYRPIWTDVDGRPRVGIGLGWERGRVTFAGGSRPYTGVYVFIGERSGPDLHADLSSRLVDVRKRMKYIKGPNWPAWRYEGAPVGEYWRDLRPYRVQLMDAVRAAWEAMSGHVDAAIGAYPTTAPAE